MFSQRPRMNGGRVALNTNSKISYSLRTTLDFNSLLGSCHFIDEDNLSTNLGLISSFNKVEVFSKFFSQIKPILITEKGIILKFYYR